MLSQPRFPAVQSILWDRTPTRPPYICPSSSSSSKTPSLLLADSALLELANLISPQKDAAESLEPSQLIAKAKYLSDSNTVLIHHVTRSSGPSLKESLNVPIMVHGDSSGEDLRPSPAYLLWMAQQIRDRLSQFTSDINVKDLFEFRLDAQLIESGVRIHGQVVHPGAHCMCVEVPPLSCLQCPLGEWLMTGEPPLPTLLTGASTLFGYLTLDSARRAVPLLHTDPMVHRVPLVGVWVKPAHTAVQRAQEWAAHEPPSSSSSSVPILAQWVLGQPDVWCAVLRYLCGCGTGVTDTPRAVEVSPSTLLLALYPPCKAPTVSAAAAGVSAQSPPMFFEATVCPPVESREQQLRPHTRSFRQDLLSLNPWDGNAHAYSNLSVCADVSVGDGAVVGVSPNVTRATIRLDGEDIPCVYFSLRSVDSPVPPVKRMEFAPDVTVGTVLPTSVEPVLAELELETEDTPAPHPSPQPPSQHPSTKLRGCPPPATGLDATSAYAALTHQATASSQTSLILLQQQQINTLQAQVSSLEALVKKLFTIVESSPAGMSYARAKLDVEHERQSVPTVPPPQPHSITNTGRWIPDDLYERWQRQWADAGKRSVDTAFIREVASEPSIPMPSPVLDASTGMSNDGSDAEPTLVPGHDRDSDAISEYGDESWMVELDSAALIGLEGDTLTLDESSTIREIEERYLKNKRK